MTFEQVMTVVAVAAGPVGIGLGWGLTQWGENMRAKSAATAREKAEDADRAIRLLAAATTVESEGRTLAHAAHLRGRGTRLNKEQVIVSMNTCNAAMRDLDRLILEAEVFGPDGLADTGRMLQDCGRDLVGRVHDMQVHLTDADVEKVQAETLPGFLAAIKKATKDVRTLIGKQS